MLAKRLSILGIDIAKKSFRVALLREGKVRNRGFENTTAGFQALSEWLLKHGESEVHACLEATNVYGEALATFLYEGGHEVSVVNPARIKAFAASELARNKTDPADAALIARFCLAQSPERWAPLPRPVRELQSLVRRLEALQEMRQQEENRLEVTSSPLVVTSITTTVAHLDQQIAKLLQQIKDHINNDPDLKRQQALLTSIPGIGDLTAARFLAEAGPVERYRGARELAAHLGLTPSQRQSGEWHGKTRLSKLGNSRLRKALYFPAITAMTHNPLVKEFTARLLAKGKAPKAALGAAMRKLVHIAFGVLRSGLPFNPQILAQA